MKKSTKNTLRIFRSHAKHYPWAIGLQCVSSAVVVLVGFILLPLFMREVIDLMTEFSGIDSSTLWDELKTIFLWIVLINIGVFILARRVHDFSTSYFQMHVLKDLTDHVFSKLQTRSQIFFANHFVGSLVSKSFRFIHGFEVLADMFIFNLWPNVIRFILSSAVLLWINPTIGILLIIWGIIYCIIVGIFTTWKMQFELEDARMSSVTSGNLADVITNNQNLKIFSNSNYEKDRFGEITDQQLLARKINWYLGNVGDLIQSVLMVILELSILYMMLSYWTQNLISIGTIVLVQTYLIQIYTNLWDFGKIIRDTSKAIADSEEMSTIIQTTPDITDPVKPEKVKIKKGAIEFQNIDFDYGQAQAVFDDFSLKIKSGEKIGLVGHSGAGKSTITKLLLRFVDVGNGAILIDGQDIRNITQDDLRRNISFVPQDPILFHRSLRENIRYGDLEASDSEVEEAAKKAHAHEFITATAQGYDTLVGERGVKLSGGERQRIAIARAFLKKAPILILDEATSSLDSVSETKIQSALETLMQGKTTIVIAHRLSTLRQMDRIVVLETGKVVEEGSHEKLLEKKNGVYAELWNHQVGGFLCE